MDWTAPQPGEREGKTRKRRDKIKSMLVKASQAFINRMSVLTDLRNRSSCNKRPEFGEAINTLRIECRKMWQYFVFLCERGAGEESFLWELRKTLQQASEDGSQAVRRGG